LKKVGDTSSTERKGTIESAGEGSTHLVTVTGLEDGQYYIAKIKVGNYAVEYAQPTDLTKIKTISGETPQVRFDAIDLSQFLRNEPREITITDVPSTFGTNGVVRVDGRVLASTDIVREGNTLKVNLVPGEREVVLVGTDINKRRVITVVDRASVPYSSFTNVETETETEDSEEEDSGSDPNGGRIRVINVPENGKVFARKGSLNTEITIEDGSGVSSRIQPGRWEVRVEVDEMRQNGLDRSVTVVAGEDLEINFANSPDSSIRLRITNVPEGATISARGPGNVTREFPATAGTTNISDISPGQWTITIATGSSRVEKQVTISSTQTVEISATAESGTIEVKKDDLMKYGIGGAALLLLGYLALSGDEKKSKKNRHEDDE
jgi:endonuclease YncB( thermonuclease family)